MRKEKIIDILTNKYSFSKNEATGLILAGNVLVNEVPITKLGVKINIGDNIRIKKQDKYVSRAAYKLLTAFENFNISVVDKICIDVGSSTGGFTQVLLEKGAKKVFSIDCGKNLLDFSLRTNPKVIVMENSRILKKKLFDFNYKPEFAVMDVSFTSSYYIIKYLNQNLKIDEMVILIKPQFEYKRLLDKLNLNKNFNGIVSDLDDRNKIINFIKKEIEEINLKVYDSTRSKIKGNKGNVEYLFHIKKK